MSARHPSISSSDTLVSPIKDLSRIPSPKKENKCMATPRSHVPLTPCKRSLPVPNVLDRDLRPLSCVTNRRREPLPTAVAPTTTVALTTADCPERPGQLSPSDRARWPRTIYRDSELVAARARELMNDISLALEIIIKNSPPERQARSPMRPGLPLDDASFACAYGLEQYREGFRRRSMQSEPSPMKVAVEELKQELKQEIRSEIKKELKVEIETELKAEIKGEIYGDLAEELSQEYECSQEQKDHDMQQPVYSGDSKVEEPASILDTVKQLREDSSVYDDAVDDDEGEHLGDPTDPALAFFLNWRAPKRE